MKNVIIFLLALLGTAMNFQLHAQPFYDTKFIDINNLRAATGVHGDFWHVWNNTQPAHGLEFPKNSGKHLGFAMSLWMAGYDSSGVLRSAATTYRINGQEYWPGPLQGTDTSIYMQESEKWAKVWQVTKAEIAQFRSITTHTLINTPASILEWPAKGNIYARGRNNAALTITDDMAPFTDADNDGIYNPLNGDYPAIKGEEMQWFVFNDNGPLPHNEITLGNAIGAEVKGMVYGYNNNHALSNVLFYEFDIVSKQHSLDSFRLGVFADMDLGNPNDDYIGFDSSRNLAFTYNAWKKDSSGNSYDYGDSIPMAGLKFLEFEGNNCNVQASLGSFMYVTSEGGSPLGFPLNGREVYQYLHHTWRDNTPLRGYSVTGATQLISSNGYGGSGALKNFVYDDSPAGSAGAKWNECYQGNGYRDRRIVIGMPQTQLTAGQHYKLSFALVVSDKEKGNGCPTYNINALYGISDSAAFAYCNPLSSVKEMEYRNDVEVYPNPVADGVFFVKQNGNNLKLSDVEVFNSYGQKLPLPLKYSSKTITVDGSSLAPGVYFIAIRTAYGSIIKKVVRL